jgi:hypothetical protein
MYPVYDVLLDDPSLGLVRLGTTETLESAHARIVSLSKAKPGRYVIFNQLNSTSINIEAGNLTAGQRLGLNARPATA